MKKNILIITILLIPLNFFAFSQKKENSSLEFFEFNIQKKEGRIYQQIKENYGNLWLRIYKSSTEFEFYSKKHFYIEKVEYYYKKNGNYIYLGEINKNGVYDKKNFLIEKCPISDKKDYKVLGYTDYILQSPFDLGMYVLINDKYGSLDPYVTLLIDFKNDTLFVSPLEY